MKPVLFHPEAEQELEGASDYYDAQREGLGAEFEAEVQVALARIAQMPEASPVYGTTGARKCLVRRFPHTIFFVEFDEYIWVAAVAHQKRRPNYWLNRLPK